MLTTPYTLKRYSWPEAVSVLLGKFRVEFPSWRDPRYAVWGCQLLFYVVGSEYLNFAKSYSNLVLCLVTGGFVDVALTYFTKRKVIFPQSGLITATGTALLLEVARPWIFVLAITAALVSKHVFTRDGRHVFNPTTLGVVLVLSLFPQWATTNAAQWTGSPWVWALVVILGIPAAWHARALDVAVAWVAAYYAVAVARVLLGFAPAPLSYVIPAGAGFALYTFFMITDPKTMPYSTRNRVLFAFFVAICDGFVRSISRPNSLYFGLMAAQYLIWAFYAIGSLRMPRPATTAA